METTEIFVESAKWVGIFDLVCWVLTLVAFGLKWGFRFRLVGVSAFTAVLTAGLFGLSLGLFSRPTIPGASRYALVYDSGSTQATIAIAPDLDRPTLEATLRQAASDLYSPGRIGQNGSFTVRARTLDHSEPGVSRLLYLGQAQRSLSLRQDDNIQVEIFDSPKSPE